MEARLVQQVPTFVVVVQYMNNWPGSQTRDYDFLCEDYVKEGDLVVVESSNGFGVAKVIGIKKQSRAATKWVVQRIDVSRHIQRVQDSMRKAELKNAMDKRLKEVGEMDRYKAAAEKDPQLAALFKEYEMLHQTLVWDQHPVKVESDTTEVKDDPVWEHEHQPGE